MESFMQLRHAIFHSRTDTAKVQKITTSTWRLAVAGGVAGMITNTLLHPLDTVKTVRQTNPKTFRGVLPTIFTLIRTRGIHSLYAGIVPALIGSALSSALYFSAYERARTVLRAVTYDGHKRAALTALSAACGNITSSILFVPKEVVKQRMQVASAQSSDFLTVATGVWRTYGIRGLYQGYKATLLRNIPSTMLRFALYEELKVRIRHFNQIRNRSKSLPSSFSPDASAAQLVVAGALSGAFASTMTTPMDVLKTRFATGAFPPHTTIPSAFLSIVREQGLAGLFVGVRPRALWAALFAAVGFSSYEACKFYITPKRGLKSLSKLSGFSERHQKFTKK